MMPNQPFKACSEKIVGRYLRQFWKNGKGFLLKRVSVISRFSSRSVEELILDPSFLSSKACFQMGSDSNKAS